MKIESVTLKNFRCFEEVAFKLNEKYTVLVGVNGAGKSAILDAVVLVLNSFVRIFEGCYAEASITKEDVRFKTFAIGSTLDRQEQLPAKVELVVWAENIKYRANTTKAKTRGRPAAANELRPCSDGLESYAQNLLKAVQNGSADKTLPLLAYYGTGRLWQHKAARASRKNATVSSRQNGYAGCLQASSNEKEMLNWFEKMTFVELQDQKSIAELETVKKAMAECYKRAFPDTAKIEVRYSVKSSELEIVIHNDDETIEYLPFRMLSDGIKSTLSMIGDIAYRMAVLNPQLMERVLADTPGIVLIDEIDMHLHPAWQKHIIQDLGAIFPQVQFIVTTHAPSVLANVKKEHILILDDMKVYEPSNTTYGRDVTAILREVMAVEVRPAEIVSAIEEFYRELDSGNLDQASKVLHTLENALGSNDEEVVAAKVSLDLEEIGGEP